MQEVDTAAVASAIGGETATEVVADYRGVEVLSSYAPLTFTDGDGQPVAELESQLDYAILAEIDLEEIMQPAVTLQSHIVMSGVLVGLAVAVVSWLFARGLVKPILAVVDRVRDIAEGEGNLRLRLDDNRQDELGALSKAINLFIGTQNDLIRQIQQEAGSVAAAAHEIAASSEQMLAGIGEQTQMVGEISGAVGEVGHAAEEVSRKSLEVSQNAAEAGKVAESGGAAVAQTVEDMRQINEVVRAGTASVQALGERGEQIGQIIAVINDIADQTNLLALNAAIEAARAGEHGRGFAVVADEVRKLADRTTKATDEIAQSIRAIQDETGQAVSMMNAGMEQVSQGVDRATGAGASLKQIVDNAKELAQRIESIVAAAEEQASSTTHVTDNVTRITSVAEQTNDSANQMTCAAQQLSQNAESLRKITERFIID